MKKSSDSYGFLKKDELNSLDSKIKDSRDRLIFHLLLETGCSVNEIISIKPNNIDFSEKILYLISSNQDIIKINLSEELHNEIQNYIKEKKLTSSKQLFSTRQSGGISARRVEQLLKKYSNKAIGRETTPTEIKATYVVKSIFLGKFSDEIVARVGQNFFNSILNCIYSNYKSDISEILKKNDII